MTTTTAAALQPFLPRLVLEWQERTPEALWQEIEGSMVFVDVSGFTKMSERLARHGNVGAEEVTGVIRDTFASLLEEAYAFGGSLLKFGGDALLLFFSGEEHPKRAAAAAYGMRAALRRIGTFTTSAGKVTLRMSVGAHTGMFDFFLVGESHRELIVAGPAVTQTVAMESAASAGQILLSHELADRLPEANRGRVLGPGVLLRGPLEAERVKLDIVTPDIDLTPFISRGLRDIVLEGGLDPEHRPVTIAFIHYSDFDDLVQSAGTDLAAKALDELVRDVQQAVDARHVSFLGSDISANGGKLILTAGAPDVTGNDEEQMLLALREIVAVERALPVEIGVNRGHVFAGEIGPFYRRTYTVMGDAVNLAARLMAKAAPGQVLATEQVLAGSRTLFETADLEPFYVKGKKRPVTAYSVRDAKGSRAHITEAGLPLVGRDSELKQMLTFWKSVQQGSGRLVEVAAEAGMGKSRLLEEFLNRNGMARAYRTECRLYQAATPYFPFRSLLRQLLGLQGLDDKQSIEQLERLVAESAPDLLPWLSLIGVPLALDIEESQEVRLLEDQFRRSRLEESVVALLAATLTEPSILTIEDAHWMDEASRDLVRRFAADLPDHPWLLLLTKRPEDQSFVPLEADWATRLELQPLGIDQAAALIVAATENAPLLPQQVTNLASRAEGNPLFLIELLDALRRGADVEALPDSVEGLITARLDRLSPADRTLLRHVSVLGSGFLVGHVGAVLPGSRVTDAARPLQRLADFLFIEPSGWVRFRHALIRDVAYEGLPYRTRQQLHAQVGQSIMAAAGDTPEDQAELLSLHFFHAGRAEEAWRFSKVAGEKARKVYANMEAAAFFTRCLRAARNLGSVATAEVAGVVEALGNVYDLLGWYDEAGRAFRRARRLVTDPVDLARLCLKEAWIEDKRGNFSQALRWITRGWHALKGIETIPAEAQRAQLSVWRAAMRYAQGRYAEAIKACEQAIVEAQRAGDRDALAHAYSVHDLARVWAGRPGTNEYSWRALSIYEELEDLSSQAFVSNNLGAFAYFDGRWADAVALYERSREARLKSGNPVEAARAATNIAEILCDRGDLGAAEELLVEALRVWRAAGFAFGVAFVLSLLGRVASRAGRFAEAASRYEEARQAFDEIGARYDVLETDTRIAENLVLQGLGRQAKEELDRAQQEFEVQGGAGAPLMRLKLLQGMAAAQLGETEAALKYFDDLISEARQRGARYEVALGLAARSRLRRMQGADDWESGLEESWSIEETLGIVSIPRVPLSQSG